MMITYDRYEQPRQPEQQPPRSRAQQMFILCDRDRSVIADLIEYISHLAVVYDRPFEVLLYGATAKQRQGFLILFFMRGIPPQLLEALRLDAGTLDYLVYDVAAESMLLPPEVATNLEDFPGLPDGYQLVVLDNGKVQPPAPLLGATDGRSIALVSNPTKGVGILLYQEQQELCFLEADVAIAALYFMLLMSQPLLDYSDPNLHPAARECLHVLWWIEQQARAAQELDGSEEGQA